MARAARGRTALVSRDASSRGIVSIMRWSTRRVLPAPAWKKRFWCAQPLLGDGRVHGIEVPDQWPELPADQPARYCRRRRELASRACCRYRPACAHAAALGRGRLFRLCWPRGTRGVRRLLRRDAFAPRPIHRYCAASGWPRQRVCRHRRPRRVAKAEAVAPRHAALGSGFREPFRGRALGYACGLPRTAERRGVGERCARAAACRRRRGLYRSHDRRRFALRDARRGTRRGSGLERARAWTRRQPYRAGEDHAHEALARARRREFASKWRFDRALRALSGSPFALADRVACRPARAALPRTNDRLRR